MINMATMARDECSISIEERAFEAWLFEVQNILSSEVNESAAFDLFTDGCSPDEAADEFRSWY